MARQTGIRVRHSRSCLARMGGKCGCHPSYEAAVYSRRDGAKIRKTFSTETEARHWRHDAVGDVRRGKLKSPTRVTLWEAANVWIEGAKEGTVRNRSGDAYKPSVIRSYDAALRLHVLPDLGAARLSEIRRTDVQNLADRMQGAGKDPSTIRNALMPLRAIFRRAVARGDLSINPTTALELPAVRGKRDRIAAPDEAARLLAALPTRDRALWATAMYAGLRRGELQALRIADVDLAGGIIRVERSWDVEAGPIETKSRSGRRTVPILAALRDYLDEHMLGLGWKEGLVFGRSPESAFDPRALARRAETAWKGSYPSPCTSAGTRSPRS
jgi:integrase